MNDKDLRDRNIEYGYTCSVQKLKTNTTYYFTISKRMTVVLQLPSFSFSVFKIANKVKQVCVDSFSLKSSSV